MTKLDNILKSRGITLPTKACIVKAMVFPVVICGSAGQESACNVGDLGLTTGLGRSPGEGKATHSSTWPGEFHGLYSPRGHKESDVTE